MVTGWSSSAPGETAAGGCPSGCEPVAGVMLTAAAAMNANHEGVSCRGSSGEKRTLDPRSGPQAR